MSELLNNLGTAAMTLTAGVLAAIAVRAWMHTRRQKVLFLMLGFVVFFLKGLILSAALFLSGEWGKSFLPVSIALDLTILVLFYLAILKRSRP